MVEFLRGQWKEFTGMVDGLSIMLMEGLLLVPVVMFAFFYPLQVLMWVTASVIVAVAIFETVLYRRHHPHVPRPKSDGWHFPL